MNALPHSIKAAAQILLCGALVLATQFAPAQAARSHASYPPLRVGAGLGSPYVHVFNLCNPNLYGDTAGGAYGTIYETLEIIDYGQYKDHPMLATSHTWSKDLKTLTFTIREGVKWSDGVPFTAKDVYFTLWTLPKKAGLCDELGVTSKKPAVTSVTMPSPDQIAIHFATADATRLFSLVNGSWIAPQHQYAQHLKDMATWTDPDPVGTGPFARLLNFSPQSYDLGKNPYYWQPGKPAFDVLRLQDYTSQDAANLALESGQVDWSNATIPNASKLYDARNPQYFHHYYGPRALCSNTLDLLTLKYPYSLVAFRKALSMAINRQALNINADYSAAPPADVQGIANSTNMSGPWPQWVDKSIPQTLVQYNPAAAKAMLKSAGFTWNGSGQLIDPHGHPVAMKLIPAFSLAESPILAQNFKALGIDVTVTNLQFGAFFDRMQKGQFDAVDAWCNGGETPYWWYEPMLDVLYDQPVGTNTLNWNFERWHNPAMDRLFAEYRQTIDPAQQRELIDQMQRLFVQYLPVIPTVLEPYVENYNTQNYTGYPTATDMYAYPEPFGYPTDTELILLHIHPTH